MRPEDNLTAATVEIVEAALASSQPEGKLLHRCRIPSVVSDVRLERAATAESPEHEIARRFIGSPSGETFAKAHEPAEATAAAGAKPANAGSAATTVAESTLRVDAARIDAVMNLVGELIIGKSMLNRTLTEFDQKHARDPCAQNWRMPWHFSRASWMNFTNVF